MILREQEACYIAKDKDTAFRGQNRWNDATWGNVQVDFPEKNVEKYPHMPECRWIFENSYLKILVLTVDKDVFSAGAVRVQYIMV